MVIIDQWAFSKSGSRVTPDNKWEPVKGSGEKGTHEKSFNWNDPADGLWDKLLQNDLN